MRISKKTEYAVHSIIYISYHIDRPVLLDELANQGISREYLAKVMRLLTKAGILKSSVGVKGGYTLNRETEDISLGDIFNAVEGESFYSCEADSRKCHLEANCGITAAFETARETFVRELNSHCVKDIIEKYKDSLHWTDSPLFD